MRLVILQVFIFFISVQCYGQIKNASFEHWDTINAHGYNQFSPTSWKAITLNGVKRVTDSFSGNNSLMLHTWYSYSTSNLYQTGSLDFKPAYLSGYYKNIPGGDNKPRRGIATIYLTKTIGKTKINIVEANFSLDTSSIFIPFQFPISYNSEASPDSFYIKFENGYGLCNDGVCGFLYLDDIKFIPFENTSINYKIKSENSITLYPNPVNNVLNIEKHCTEIADLQIFNATGKIINEVKLNEPHTQIEISALPKGMYFYKIYAAGEIFKSGKILKN